MVTTQDFVNKLVMTQAPQSATRRGFDSAFSISTQDHVGKNELNENNLYSSKKSAIRDQELQAIKLKKDLHISSDLVTLILKDRTGTLPQTKSLGTYAWYVRDPIYTLMSRYDIFNKCAKKSHDVNYIKKMAMMKKKPWKRGNKFNITSTLARIRTDKVKISMIQQAFDAAGISILRGLERQRKSARLNLIDAMTSGKVEGLVRVSSEEQYIPPLILTLKSLENYKNKSIETTMIKREEELITKNYDIINNMNPCIEPPLKKSKMEGQEYTNCQISDRNKDNFIVKITNLEKENIHMKSKFSNLPPSSTDEKNCKNNISNATGISLTPSHNTYTSSQFSATHASTTNHDSRAMISRAILCVATSLDFKMLTPDYEDRKELIDVLDVPQNTQSEVSNIKRGTTTVGNNNCDIIVKNQDNNKSKHKGKPIINMGAVMMSAEIFSNRSIEQARGAARRGDWRRKWRLESIRCDLAIKNINSHGSMPNSSSFTMWDNFKNIFSLRDGMCNIITENISDFDNDRCDPNEIEEKVSEEKEERTFNSEYKRECDIWKRDIFTNDHEWTQRCLPRLLKILHVGPGHAVLHDMKWASRANRIVQVLQGLAKPYSSNIAKKYYNLTHNLGKNDDYNRKSMYEPNYGPHLIVTTASDIPYFVKVLAPMEYFGGSTPLYKRSIISSSNAGVISCEGTNFCGKDDSSLFFLRALLYCGSEAQRCRTRLQHFTSTNLGGLKESPFHVILTTYETFIKDYIHLCQIPFQAVIMDDGMSWLGTAHFDPNGQLGKVWEMGIFSRSNNHAGLAGVGYYKWDFSLMLNHNDGCLTRPEAITDEEWEIKKKISNSPLVGLSVRHKILLASSMYSKYRDVVHPAPVPGLLSFLLPQFADVVKEEWDRSRIQNCFESMTHIRKLLCRSVVVYTGSIDHSKNISTISVPPPNMFSLALQSMLGCNDRTHLSEYESMYSLESHDSNGSIGRSKLLNKTFKYREITTDEMISTGKLVQSRRFAASWLRSGSPIRYELGSAPIAPILNIIKARSFSGNICEEVVTTSSISSSGAAGIVSGPSAYKAAVRCGRTFGSEQGLRQHMAALHAPPGTWLCRSCGDDCGTSQARTHHERSCGTHISVPGSVKENSTGGGIPTVGQGIGSVTTSATIGSKASEDKDKDGCFRVPGYRGVWVNESGKHFVKIDDTPLVHDTVDDRRKTESQIIILFGNADDAARRYDYEMKKLSKDKEVKINFKDDGSRIVYKDSSSSATMGRGLEMLGGGASSVVPALSVINIKDLPKGVVPLLRDPRQTSRTGGNSKRYIYAYRGVCRQARKGHDRWQSQISFGGTNHYLGTFDSEWDAAAIYAWAHLILYGAEATRKAQKEGEEAVAAWEQEKKDIAEGKIISPAPKSPKVKPTSKKKQIEGHKVLIQKKCLSNRNKPSNTIESLSESTLSLMIESRDNILYVNECSTQVPKVTGLISKYGKLPHNDKELVRVSKEKIIAWSERRLLASNSMSTFKPIGSSNICIPVDNFSSKIPHGCAMLVGLSSADFSWSIDDFFHSARHLLSKEPQAALSTLRREFGVDGYNALFRSVIQYPPCLIGRAGAKIEKASSSIGLGNVVIGGTIGGIDCHVGGIDGSCSEIAGCISFSLTENSFQFSSCNNDDIVTLNGKQMQSSMGTFLIQNEAVLSVGSRVFMFFVPASK